MTTKQRTTNKNSNNKNENSNNIKSPSLDDIKKEELSPFQNINNIINEFNKQENEKNDVVRIPHKFWDNYWVKKIIRIIEIIFWISLGTGTAYKTDLVNVVLYSNEINRVYFNIGLAGLFGFIIIYTYCGYFSKVDTKKNDLDWEKMHPKLIPFATICLITFTFGIIIGCWTVWGLLTPILILIYFASISYII